MLMIENLPEYPCTAPNAHSLGISFSDFRKLAKPDFPCLATLPATCWRFTGSRQVVSLMPLSATSVSAFLVLSRSQKLALQGLDATFNRPNAQLWLVAGPGGYHFERAQ